MASDSLFSAQEIDAVLRPFGEARFLPPRAYSDPEVFSLERRQVFRHSWLPVARTSELPKPGDYLRRDIFGESIALVRSAGGVIRAFSNVCRHRARTIIDGPGSTGGAKRLTCPYHAWSYGLDGQLAAAPCMERTPGFSVADWKLPEFAVDVWQGFVFVNLDAAAKPLSPQLRTLDRILAPLGLADMGVKDFCRYNAPWDWKATMDNFTEGYHQPTIHRDSVEPTVPSKLATYDDVDGPYSLFWMPAAENVEFQAILPEISGLPGKFRGGITIVNVYPLLHLLIDQSSVMWLDWDIRGNRDHDICWRLLAPASTFGLPDFAERERQLLGFLKTVWDEDFSACKGVADGTQSGLAQQGRMSYQEKSVHQFHRWMMQSYVEAIAREQAHG